ncbi:MAG: potassium/proton antiporter [Candidatus Gastranaerophilales bacterium]|nr:potassium/proton antiporter [Candidatus Gastranaerophilales bacterium]
MDKIILITSVMFLAAVTSSKLAGKFGVPSLLIFITVGILFGSDGIGSIYFDNYYTAQFIGIIALVYILFMGGLSVNMKEVKPVVGSGIILATIGVLITTVITGFLGHYFLDLNFKECLLLGAIVSSTDAAAVFSILRSKDINLKKNLKPLLEFESGSNDPMAVFLTISAVSLITGEITSYYDLIFMFFKQMILGIIFGFVIGKAAVKLINKIRLEYNGLYVVLTTAIVAFAYSLPPVIGGNGFMSVYVCGLTMSASKFVHKRMLTNFHDGIAWLMQIIMFLMLGLLVFVKNLYYVIKPALIITLILVFIARPIAVFISMIGFKESFKEKLFISWVGLRGAAPIVLATFPLLAGINHSHEIFNIIFFVVIVSVVIQGTTIPLTAKLLNVDAPASKNINSPIEFEAGESDKKLFEFQIECHAPAVNKALKDLILPNDTLITMISRGSDYLIPSGNTIFEECDIVFIFSDYSNEDKLKEIFDKAS